MSRIRLLLDEDTPLLLAHVLRARGHDVVHAVEIGLKSEDDEVVMDQGIAAGRAVMTHNVRDYMAMVDRLAQLGRSHCGLLLAPQVEFRELLVRTLHTLADHDGANLTDAVIWV